MKALAPFIALQVAVGGLVFAWPAITHMLDAPAEAISPAAAPSEDDIVRQMEEMARQPEDAASAPDK